MGAQPHATRKYDQLSLHIQRAQAPNQPYQVRCVSRGQPTVYGPLGDSTITIADIQALQRRYERQQHLARELASAGMPTPPPDEQPLLAIGRHVAELLPTDVRQTLIIALQRARRKRHGLRVVLEIAADAPALLGIPWELLALPLDWANEAESFVFLTADTTLVRQIHGLGHFAPLELARPLQLQAFAATPRDAQPIDLQATQAAIPSNRTAAQWYAGPNTLEALQERLRSTNPQIVHLLCHGEQCDTGLGLPRYDLLLTHADGNTQRVTAIDLARVLSLAPALQMVLLQSCYSGTVAVGGAAQQQAVASIALALLRAGVPLVIAMQGEVAQSSAEAFVRACYATLAQGGCVGQAVAAGRIAMRSAGGIADWSLPVIYQGSQPQEQTGWLTRLSSFGQWRQPAPLQTAMRVSLR